MSLNETKLREACDEAIRRCSYRTVGPPGGPLERFVKDIKAAIEPDRSAQADEYFDTADCDGCQATFQYKRSLADRPVFCPLCGKTAEETKQ